MLAASVGSSERNSRGARSLPAPRELGRGARKTPGSHHSVVAGRLALDASCRERARAVGCPPSRAVERRTPLAMSQHVGPPRSSDYVISETVITFCFEVLTDVAFVPPLLVMRQHRRHFELYIGTFQLVTGFLYNFCNALNVNVFLTELQWHGLNNILTTTYFLLLLIHLQANSNPTVDIVLRYAAFTAVWIAQIKDEYWNPQWTAMVVLAFCLMPVCKFGGAMRLPPYDTEKLCKGFVAGAAAAICFVIGLDDTVDPFRLFHGLSQALVGAALYCKSRSCHASRVRTTGCPDPPPKPPPCARFPLRAHTLLAGVAPADVLSPPLSAAPHQLWLCLLGLGTCAQTSGSSCRSTSPRSRMITTRRSHWRRDRPPIVEWDASCQRMICLSLGWNTTESQYRMPFAFRVVETDYIHID